MAIVQPNWFSLVVLLGISWLVTCTISSPIEKEDQGTGADKCKCQIPQHWYAQAGQDKYLFEHLFFRQNLCCKGKFVEFGARNGLEHSNTAAFEKEMGWTGLLFEVDPREHASLKVNRPNSEVIIGPVCPSNQESVTIALASIPGWTGDSSNYEETRRNRIAQEKTFDCKHLAKELRARNMTKIDYMTIDTEGSEVHIIEDFPWDEFDIHVVQIEQLNAIQYSHQQGKKERIIEHMKKVGYKLLSVYIVAVNDTDDLIFTRNIDAFLNMTQDPRNLVQDKHPRHHYRQDQHHHRAILRRRRYNSTAVSSGRSRPMTRYNRRR